MQMIKVMDNIQSIANESLHFLESLNCKEPQIEAWAHLFVSALSHASYANQMDMEEREVILDFCRWLIQSKNHQSKYSFSQDITHQLLHTLEHPISLDDMHSRIDQMIQDCQLGSESKSEEAKHTLLIQLYEGMFRVVFADGIFQSVEKDFLKTVALKFSISEQEIAGMAEKYKK